jgi:cell division protein FtsL
MTSLLAGAVLVSALAQVTAKHQARQLFVELERLKGERDQLQIEWGQLQLEQSTWATHARMENLGRGELALVIPTPQEVVLVAEKP